jgi:hypothetical protein
MSIFGFTVKKSSGDFMPILQYDAKAGRLFRRDSVQTINGWEKEKVDITNTFKAIAAMDALEIGWIDFGSGGPPSFVMVPFPGYPLPECPGPNFQQGLRVTLKLAKGCGGDVRQMAGTSNSFRASMEKLYPEYQAGMAANPGKLPVIIMPETLPVTTGSGVRQSTNYQPVWQIVGWADRQDLPPPNAMVAQAPQQARPLNGGPPATGSQYAAPPAQQPPWLTTTQQASLGQQPPQQRATATVSPDDFG